MRLRYALAFGCFAFVAYACGGSSSLGSGSGSLEAGGSSGTGGGGSGEGGTGGTGGAGTYEPCAGKVCGSPCSSCPPNDPKCAETAVLKYCDANGGCGVAFPACPPAASCSTDNECPQMGAPCEQCPDGTYACPSVQCLNGACVGSFDTCRGEVCTSDNDCPAIGAPCTSCPDGSVACPWSRCVNGTCAGGFDACGGYQPCANKQCGDTCSQCDPNDPTCAETAIIKFCDAAGVCSSNTPTCGNSGGTCNTDSDCPGLGACPMCTDGSCAENRCIGGSCKLACADEVPKPQCSSASDCVTDLICIYCDKSGTCAQTECINGTCQRVCR